MLDWKSRQELQFAPYKDVAVRLLSKINCFAPPVDVETLARIMGVDEVRREDLGNISGSLIRGKRKNIVLLNSAQSLERQRFTLAHEIAHLYFGDNHEEGSIQWRRPVPIRDNRERRCDAFASELLLPWHLIHSQLENSLHIDTIIETARDFNVSIESAALRLGSLSTESLQMVAWQRGGSHFVQKWTTGTVRIMPKGHVLDLADKSSSAVQATLIASVIAGSEKIHDPDKVSMCIAESRAFGKVVISILRKIRRPSTRKLKNPEPERISWSKGL